MNSIYSSKSDTLYSRILRNNLRFNIVLRLTYTTIKDLSFVIVRLFVLPIQVRLKHDMLRIERLSYINITGVISFTGFKTLAILNVYLCEKTIDLCFL